MFSVNAMDYIKLGYYLGEMWGVDYMGYYMFYSCLGV
jgi:hypothetical protein